MDFKEDFEEGETETWGFSLEGVRRVVEGMQKWWNSKETTQAREPEGIV